MVTNSGENNTAGYIQTTAPNEKQLPKSEQSKWKKAERSKRRFRRYIFLPIFILGLPFILAYTYCLIDYFQTVIFEHGKTYREMVVKRQQDHTTKLIGEAYTHLHRNEADDAQRMFNYILQENRYDYWANYGMTQTLFLQCNEKNLYCELAKQYGVFTKGLNSKHHAELNLVLSRLE